MFTSDIVPQAGVLVTVSWWTRWSRGTRITRPPWGSGVTRPTRRALAACPPFTRQAWRWEYTKSVINKKDSNMVTPGGLRIQKERAETTKICTLGCTCYWAITPTMLPWPQTKRLLLQHEGDEVRYPERKRLKKLFSAERPPSRGSRFLFTEEKLLHQGLDQQSAQIWNQYFEGSPVCQVLKLLSHKYSTTAERMKRESFPLYLAPRRQFAYTLVFRLFSDHSKARRFVSLCCEYWLRNSTLKIQILIKISKTSNSTAWMGKSIQRELYSESKTSAFFSESDSTGGKSRSKTHKASVRFHWLNIWNIFGFVQRKHNGNDST